MTGQEMVSNLRESLLDDLANPSLWSTVELLRFLNYAEVQACRRAHLIIDATTANDNGTAATAGTAGQKPLCTLVLVPDQATYNLSPKILQVKRLQIVGMNYPLDGPKTYADLDNYVYPGWVGTSGTAATAGTNGYPSCFLNEPGSTITLLPAPSTTGPAYLVVSRIPLTPFTLLTSPEIDEKYHEGLMDWAAHLAYMKRDSDTLNLNLAKLYDDKFSRQFGPLPDAYSDRMRKTLNQKVRMRPREFGS